MLRGLAVAVLALLAVLTTVPATSGAWTADIADSDTRAGVAPWFDCASAYAASASDAYFQWPLTEAAGATQATDVSGSTRSGIFLGGSTGADDDDPMACPAGGGTALRLDGTNSIQDSGAVSDAPQTFTIEAWFRTTTKQGLLIGYGDRVNTAGTDRQLSNLRDRALYIDANGDVNFGIIGAASPYSVTYLYSSTGGYADGRWHLAVATYSSAGAALWLDGERVMTADGPGAALQYAGNWRVGFEESAGIRNNPGSASFIGSLRWIAAYRTVLSASTIRAHWAAGAPAVRG